MWEKKGERVLGADCPGGVGWKWPENSLSFAGAQRSMQEPAYPATLDDHSALEASI